MDDKLFRALVENSSDAIFLADNQGLVTYSSASLTTVLGYTAEELMGTSGFALVHPDDIPAAQAVFGECIGFPARHVPFALRVKHKNGSYIDVEGVLQSRLADPAVRAVVVNYRDVSDKKRAEAALAAAEAEKRRLEAQIMHAQKLESLGLLAGGIAHDFNNILTGILGFASLARMDLPPDSDILPLLDEIEQGGHRAADLAQQMLAYSGRGRFVIRTFAIDATVREMNAFLVAAISKKAHFKLDLKPAPVDGDASQLRQVMMNLIIIASDALGGDEGHITVRTGTRLCTKEALRSRYVPENLSEGRYTFIEVKDNGGGMTEDTLGRLFDPFFTTRDSGRGLGLASVLGIVRGHRGTIRVTSSPGKGALFEVLIPASTNPVPESAPAPEHLPLEAHNTGTILVVDDEDSVRTFVASVLQRAGFDVLLASDGEEGVEEFRREVANISAVLLDLTMPRMDGLEVAQKIKGIRGDIPILLMSGYNEQDISRQFSELGVSGFIKKPFTTEALASAVAHILPVTA